MIAVTGLRTTIVQELAKLSLEQMVRIDADWSQWDAPFSLPDTDRFVFAAGHLVGKSVRQQSGEDLARTFAVNTGNVLRLCEAALRIAEVRVVVIGSRSAVNGSHDAAYAAAKAGVHAYVKNAALMPGQRLICIAPPIIADSGMTLARHDYPAVLSSRKTVTARQVAEKVWLALEGGIHERVVLM